MQLATARQRGKTNILLQSGIGDQFVPIIISCLVTHDDDSITQRIWFVVKDICWAYCLLSLLGEINNPAFLI